MEIDVQNHTLGAYIRIAFNDPKKYPKQPFLYKTDETVERNENKVMTSSEMEQIIRINNKLLGGKVIKHES